MLGAVLGAEPAGRAFVRIDIPRAHPQLGGKIAWLSVQGKKISVAQNFNIGRPTGLYQLRREYSKRTVVGRKGFIQLCHVAANGGFLFDQVNLETLFSQVEGGLHTGDPSADNHNRSNDFSSHAMLLIPLSVTGNFDSVFIYRTEYI